MWFAFRGDTELNINREPGMEHQFLVLTLRRGFLLKHVPGPVSNLHHLVKGLIKQNRKRSSVSEIRQLDTLTRSWVSCVRRPPVLASAQSIWYLAKALESVSDHLFVDSRNEELFCRRHKRLSLERATKVQTLLAQNMTEPPSLKEIGLKVGCSPCYLSRIFSQEVGMTIPQYLRRVRLEKAAELLRRGEMNVTEVALEVGYDSLSHFSQAFCQQMGCCPSMYPLEK